MGLMESSKDFNSWLNFSVQEVTEDDCGCYHQQYYLDNKLVAVGVVDILPTCLSSVYFFYDPVFADLTLGTFGALTEIAFVRERAQTHPEFQFYYMGFYIHSCPKMRYKGSYTPSYLLCPETFNWKLLDDKLRRELDNTKYLAFGAASESDIPPPVPKQENIDKVTNHVTHNTDPVQLSKIPPMQNHLAFAGLDSLPSEHHALWHLRVATL